MLKVLALLLVGSSLVNGAPSFPMGGTEYDTVNSDELKSGTVDMSCPWLDLKTSDATFAECIESIETDQQSDEESTDEEQTATDDITEDCLNEVEAREDAMMTVDVDEDCKDALIQRRRHRRHRHRRHHRRPHKRLTPEQWNEIFTKCNVSSAIITAMGAKYDQCKKATGPAMRQCWQELMKYAADYLTVSQAYCIRWKARHTGAPEEDVALADSILHSINDPIYA